MYPDGGGDPDPATIEVFQHQAQNPVDLETGPGGDIYYVDIINGEVRRFHFIGGNTPPIAVISAIPTSGMAPLTVDFDGSGSFDPDLEAIVSYEWDLDGDGQYDDATGVTAQRTYGAGSHTAGLRVTDAGGESGTDSIPISASNTPPVPVIDNPSSALLWQVGEVVNFSGHANDPEEGPLSASSLTWQLDLLHGEDDGSSHVHIIQTFPGVSSGSFNTPDHEYPSWLELSLTAIDQHGASASTMVRLDPETVDLTFHTAPSGLEVAFGGEIITTPFTETVIVNSVFTVSAPTPQQAPDLSRWDFASWSDGGALSHEITAPSSNTIYIAAFDGESFNGTFRDDDNSTFESAIEWLAATGITKGCNPPVNNRFCPDDFVTRGQMAAFFSRAFGYSDDGGGNLFTDDNGHLFEHEIDLLGTAGVTKGCNPPVNNRFCPDNFVTRGQMAAFFQRAYNG
jgi:PKD repeat protein